MIRKLTVITSIEVLLSLTSDEKRKAESFTAFLFNIKFHFKGENIMEEKTVRQVLQEFRKESGDPFGEGPIVNIQEGGVSYYGPASYFMFNEAYKDLCSKKAKIAVSKNYFIIVEG